MLITPIRQALARLLRAARALIAGPRPHATPKPTHPGYTQARTTEWLIALARTLAGDRFFLQPVTYIFPRFPGRYPSLTAKLREEIGLPPVPHRTEAQKATARLWYVRRVFATQPTAKIAARIARRLNLTPKDAAWPQALLAMTTPPAQLALTRPAPAARPIPAPLPPFTPTPCTPTPRDIPQRE